MPGAVGYKGYARIGTAGPVLPYRSAGITEAIAINPAEDIHGGGIGQLDGRYHSEHNFAISQAVYTGDLAGDVYGDSSAGYGLAFLEVLKRAMGASASDISLRDTGFDSTTQLVLSPGGSVEYRMPGTGGLASEKAIITTFALNGNLGGNVQFTAGMIATGMDADDSGSPNAPTVANFSFETAGVVDDSDPLPYYASSFTIGGDDGEGFDISDRVTAWTLNIDNRSSPIFVFNGNNTAVDVIQGRMIVTGTFSYYSPDGSFVRYLKHGATLTISLGDITLNLPFLAFGPYPVPTPGPDDPVVRNVTFRAVATGSYPSIYRT